MVHNAREVKRQPILIVAALYERRIKATVTDRRYKGKTRPESSGAGLAVFLPFHL